MIILEADPAFDFEISQTATPVIEIPSTLSNLKLLEEIEERIDTLNMNLGADPALTIMSTAVQMRKSSLIQSPAASSQSSVQSPIQEAIAEVLTVPALYKREGVHRIYKTLNYGVMTSDENIEQMRTSEEANKRAEAEKEKMLSMTSF